MMYTYNKQDAGVRKFDTSSVYAIDCGGRIYTLAYVNTKDGYKFKPIAGACKDKSRVFSNFTTQEAAIDAVLKGDLVHTVYEFGNEDEFYAWLGKRYAYTEPDTAPKTKPGYPNTPSIIYATIEKSTNLVMVLRHIPGGVHGTEQYGFRSISPLHAYSLVGDKATIKEAISAAEKCGHVIEVFTTDEAFMGWLGKLYAAPVLPFNGVVPRPTDTERIELLEKRVTQMRDWWGKKMDEFAETLRETLINKTKPEEDVPTRWEPSHRENGFYVVTTPTIPIPFVAHSVNGKWYIPGGKLHYAGYLRVQRKVDMNG